MDKLYLVTGAAGHLGSVITRKLLDKGRHVRAFVLPNERNIPEGAGIVFGDVCSKESIRPCFENLEGRELVVIHCAGIVSITSRFSQVVYDVNVTGTRNIVDLCKDYNVSKLVYVSSVHAIPEKPIGETISETVEFDPDKVLGVYAKTKAEASAYVLEAARQGLNACLVHPSGIIGPYDNGRGHTTTLIIDYCKQRLVSGIDGGYDFVDVRDVANGVISACERGGHGECYILSNRFYKVRELFDMLQLITGRRKIRVYLPIWFVRATARLSELYYRILKQTPLFTSYSIYTLGSNSLFSHEKARRELGFTTRDMEETLKDTVKWLKETGRI
ncbi:MAG: NAD-dependent epimerase/dehydratase family protein [Sphaerochaetaceae bacterium]